MAESRTIKTLDDLRRDMKLPDNVPTPQYAGDRGWSLDREKRYDQICDTIDQNKWASPPRVASKELLDELRALINETEEATRANPESHAGMTWMEQSKLAQGLHYTWYCLTKDRIM
jgi:hypothetical protein